MPRAPRMPRRNPATEPKTRQQNRAARRGLTSSDRARLRGRESRGIVGACAPLDRSCSCSRSPSQGVRPRVPRRPSTRAPCATHQGPTVPGCTATRASASQCAARPRGARDARPSYWRQTSRPRGAARRSRPCARSAAQTPQPCRATRSARARPFGASDASSRAHPTNQETHGAAVGDRGRDGA